MKKYLVLIIMLFIFMCPIFVSADEYGVWYSPENGATIGEPIYVEIGGDIPKSGTINFLGTEMQLVGISSSVGKVEFNYMDTEPGLKSQQVDYEVYTNEEQLDLRLQFMVVDFPLFGDEYEISLYDNVFNETILVPVASNSNDDYNDDYYEDDDYWEDDYAGENDNDTNNETNQDNNNIVEDARKEDKNNNLWLYVTIGGSVTLNLVLIILLILKSKKNKTNNPT